MPIEPPKRSVAARVALGLLRLTWTLFVVLVPLSGIWISSSLAAFGNGPIWVAILAGALAFPLVPIAWEALSELLRRRARARGPKRLSDLRSRGEGSLSGDKRILSVWDRVVLRTLVVNLLFVGGLLWKHPTTVYEAVSTRGDWMLDGVEAPWADRFRGWLHGAAERFEWLHERTHANKYEELVEDEFSGEHIEPAVVEPAVVEPAVVEPAAVAESRYEHWPQSGEPHPLIMNMPAEAEASITAVANYVVGHEQDPRMRVKALHDWVATRVRYDLEAAEVGPIPPQDAQTVFATRTSVCAGYANLLAALITEAGGHAVVVTGDSRGLSGEMSDGGHAWNAVELDGAWYLVDATWDAGSSIDGKWEFDYDTDYLFAPPEVIGRTHFPNDPKWQLRAEPLSRGEFLRQPMMKPRFFAQGFELISPDRSQVSVADEVNIELGYRRDMYVIAKAIDSDGMPHHCDVDRGATVEVSCKLRREDQYEVRLFSNNQQSGRYWHVGTLQVNVGG